MAEGEKLCGQCDEPLSADAPNVRDGFGAEFCSEHCLNARRGDSCDPPCELCRDDEEGGGRGEPCGDCGGSFPFHTRDCQTGAKYCEGCSAYTTHCASEHCLNCCLDDYGFPTEDCGHCAGEIGGIIRVSVEGSELLGVEHVPEPGEVHDLRPTPFED